MRQICNAKVIESVQHSPLSQIGKVDEIRLGPAFIYGEGTACISTSTSTACSSLLTLRLQVMLTAGILGPLVKHYVLRSLSAASPSAPPVCPHLAGPSAGADRTGKAWRPGHKASLCHLLCGLGQII